MSSKQTEWSNRISFSDNEELEAHYAKSAVPSKDGILLVHGFPSLEIMAPNIGSDLPNLANRVAEEVKSNCLSIRFRGCGQSSGNFSLKSWKQDIVAGLDYLVSSYNLENLWICGFGTGGSLSVAAAETHNLVRGVVTVGSPADFSDWAENPEDLLKFARDIGVVKDADYPKDFESWSSELFDVQAVKSAENFGEKSLLVIHGSEDEAVPHFDARLIADGHGNADLRFINAGSHKLAQDPRAIAVLLAWFSRQKLLRSQKVEKNLE